MRKSYDVKCFDLAKAFLSDEHIASTAEEERLAHELAIQIQAVIEDFMEFDLKRAAKTEINDG